MNARDRANDAWRYDSASRRRVRALGRLADATVRARSAQPSVLHAYWWDGHPNFGDALTPWILARRGIAAVHTPPEYARVAGVGSIIEQLGEDFAGTIWGSGLMHGEPVSLPRAAVLAVRGPLTKAALGITEDIVLGDPGILVAGHARRRAARWRLGVVPHGIHRDDEALGEFVSRAGADVTVVDVRCGPGPVVGRIARCSAIVTTSLHGLIVADALQIPALWTQRTPALWGGTFKFRDYEAVMTPGRTREGHIAGDTALDDVLMGADRADADARSESIHRLEETMAHLPATPQLPWKAFSQRFR